MDIIDEGACFVCGKNNEHGLQLSFTTDAGKTICEFVVRKDFQGYKDIIHGGIVTAILDEAMIYAAMAGGLNPVTAEITVRFKQPLHADRHALAEAELTRSNNRIIEARSCISEKDTGLLIAEATAKMVPLKAAGAQ